MDGVTILNTYRTFTDGWSFILGGGITGVILLLIASIYLFVDSEPLFGGFALCLAVAITICCFRIPKATFYEVLLDDSTSWNEFAERYEIIKVRGKILTVREKVTEDCKAGIAGGTQ